jgi:predicted short-subunit dehydrogenase-like oxidoreductase (DUF2520 family)
MISAWEQYKGFRLSASGFRRVRCFGDMGGTVDAEGRKPEGASAMLPGMARTLRVAIVGAGNLGAALARSLQQAGYPIEVVIARSRGASLRKAQGLARQVGASAVTDLSGVEARLVWFCVPDAAIASAAQLLAPTIEWKGRVAVHSSGALGSGELAALRRRGAAVASVHPLMTFVRRSRPSLAGVPFAIEGDKGAVRVARRVVQDLGGLAYSIREKDKAAYHAWGTFASPLLTALLATTEEVAVAAGVRRKAARQRMIPILLQTLANYASFGAAGAFSGPIVRGDVDTVKRHLGVLRGSGAAREVYLALAASALQYLPAKNKRLLKRLLDSSRR